MNNHSREHMIKLSENTRLTSETAKKYSAAAGRASVKKRGQEMRKFSESIRFATSKRSLSFSSDCNKQTLFIVFCRFADQTLFVFFALL